MGIRAQQFGKGPDLVFLHGWGMNVSVWNSLCGLLTDRFCVHLVDLPGHGGDAGREASTDFSDWVDEVGSIVPERAAYVGWSLGGLLALKLAQTYPEKVSHLVLVGAAPKFVQSDDWPQGMKQNVLDEFINLLGRDIELAMNHFLILQVLNSVRYKVVLKTLREVFASLPQPTRAVLQSGLVFLRDLDLRDAMRGLNCPLLSLYGQHDELVSQKMVPDIEGLNKNQHSIIIPDSGHAPFLSHTAQTAVAIAEFVDPTSKS